VDGREQPLLRAVEVMDRLRSPGGCPWDAAQTHESLARYLLEETYETLEAIEAGDPALLREELGDLLLQVLFHARLAQELPPAQRFSIEDVAGDLVDKLVRRHPHVFADGSAASADEVAQSWEQLKAREKKRESLTDGIPIAQPALAYAAALVERADRAGLEVGLPTDADTDADADADAEADTDTDTDTDTDADEIGTRLFALVREAVAAGVDPETALRGTARAYQAAIKRAEAGLGSPG
jgi:XTP/dITP diphosphohydrolase